MGTTRTLLIMALPYKNTFNGTKYDHGVLWVVTKEQIPFYFFPLFVEDISIQLGHKI